MGWKGTLRSMEAASRRAERNAHRRQRELERRMKEFSKMEAREQAAYEVSVYENQIEVLTSMHKEFSEAIDWAAYAERSAPIAPSPDNSLEHQALLEQERYQPRFWTRLFRLEKRQRQALADKVVTARAEDTKRSREEYQSWESSYATWQEEYELALRILKDEDQAKIDALKLLEPFTEISNLGTSISFRVGSSGIMEASLSIHGDHVVPSEIKTLLQSGKLSSKKMPAGKFNELHQDYVCSCALRVGLELLAVIPDDLVIVTAKDSLLNSSTGHHEELPILSVAFSRSSIDRLNLETIDPSDAMSNFVHNMLFKKPTGFQATKALDPMQFVKSPLSNIVWMDDARP